MGKDETINYLIEKRDLTAGVQDARHNVFVSQQNYEMARKSLKTRLIVEIIVCLIAPNFLYGLGTVIAIIATFAGWGGIVYFAINYNKEKKQAQQQIGAAEQKVNEAKNEPAFIQGMADFPAKFYSYWTIDRLIHLVKENRATSLQEAFNIAENQDFQNDQLSLQQENLAVSKSTNTMSKVSAAANVFTAYNTHKLNKR